MRARVRLTLRLVRLTLLLMFLMNVLVKTVLGDVRLATELTRPFPVMFPLALVYPPGMCVQTMFSKVCFITRNARVSPLPSAGVRTVRARRFNVTLDVDTLYHGAAILAGSVAGVGVRLSPPVLVNEGG